MAKTPSIIPFAGADHRTLWLRVILLNACFLGMIACAPLWTNVHAFPMLPISPGFPVLSPPWDKVLFGAMLLSLIAATWFYRESVIFFLIASLFAYCQDQNRGQPWFYMYWVMLLLTLFRAQTAIAACRWGMSIVYIWSGIQKCNAHFFHNVPAWFVAPVRHWHLPPFVLDLMQRAVACAPLVELMIGLAIWVPRLRRLAIGAAVVIHLAALLFLGPLGYNYNWVVWPWNMAMPLLLWVLFAKGEYWEKRVGRPASLPDAEPDKKVPKVKANQRPEKTTAPEVNFKRTFVELCRSKLAMALVALYSLLPILSYYGMWDSYFSFALYSENSATANVFITGEFADRLPPRMKAQVHKFQDVFDAQHQGPFVFNYAAWGYEELHVPPIAEPRNFVSVFKALQAWSKEPSDLRMIVGQRSGPVIFYEGSAREYLTPQN